MSDTAAWMILSGRHGFVIFSLDARLVLLDTLYPASERRLCVCMRLVRLCYEQEVFVEVPVLF